MALIIQVIVAGWRAERMKEDYKIYNSSTERKTFYSDGDYCERISEELSCLMRYQQELEDVIQNYIKKQKEEYLIEYYDKHKHADAQRKLVSRMLEEYKNNEKLQEKWLEVYMYCVEQDYQESVCMEGGNGEKVDFGNSVKELYSLIEKQGRKLNGHQLGILITVIFLGCSIAVKLMAMWIVWFECRICNKNN